MIEVTITRQMLDTDLQSWFLNAKNAEHAKEEILAVFVNVNEYLSQVLTNI